MNNEFTKSSALFGHTDEASALLVEDYPYGFKLRTQIRYWIETTKHGDRFVSQTMNPKTDKWNKPKKSTYSEIGVMWRNPDNDHIGYVSLSHWADDEWLARFIEVTEGQLSEAQLAQLAMILATKKVMQHVTVTIHEGDHTDEDKAEQVRTINIIAAAIDRESSKINSKLQTEKDA